MKEAKMNINKHKLPLTNKVLAIFLLLLSCSAFGQAADTKLVKNVKSHISILAADSFLGRETGTPGEKMASDYIVKQFKDIGLKPLGDMNTYLQAFDFNDGVRYGKTNTMRVSKTDLVLDSAFYPLPFAANGKAAGMAVDVLYGISADSLGRNDYTGRSDLAGKIFVIESGTPDGNNPHARFGEYTDLRARIDTAIAKGALAVVFVNSDTAQTGPDKHDFHHKITPGSVPVVFYMGDKKNLLSGDVLEIEVELEKVARIGHNIVGFIDNKAQNTIVIGAHYDHLGMGGEGSLYRGAPAVHNGADDNASGTAALIELARIIKDKKYKGHNFLFLAFSGEEKGLYGSAYFTKSPVLKLATISYMLNMDMVGRLNEEKVLLVYGVGTSPEWMPALNKLNVDGIKIKTTDSGIGPSDHTSFYLKDIPVLHFFTGTHSDYHKPSDDADKVNYTGEASVVNYILALVEGLNSQDKLAFSKTKDDKNEDTPRFKVTLGVVPDYAYDGEGLRIDGISEGKAAAKAGLKAGDVVIQMGDNKVLDMMSYMKALSKFTKGAETIVKVKRDKEIVEYKVLFQ